MEVTTPVSPTQEADAVVDPVSPVVSPAAAEEPAPTAGESVPAPELPPEAAPESLLDRLKDLRESMPLISRVLAGDPTLTIGSKTYRFQMCFMAQESLIKELGAKTPEEAGQVLEARFGNEADPMGQVDTAMAALKAALLRYHGEVSADEVSDILAELTGEEVGSLLGSLGVYFQIHDGLGDYFAGKSPLVRISPWPRADSEPAEAVDGKAYVLRWTMAETQEILHELSDQHGALLNWRDCRRVLVRALKRFQPTGVSQEELDDLGWALGMAGIQRLMAGPKRKKDEPADPNAPGPATPGPGTGTPS